MTKAEFEVILSSMKIIFSALFSLLILAQSQNLQAGFDENDPLLVESQLQPLDLSPGQSGHLIFKVKLPPGYHAYTEQFKLSISEPEGFLVGPMEIKPEKKWFDKFSKKERKGVEGEATISFAIEAPTQILTKPESLKINFTYQACGESFCLFPQVKKIETIWKWNGPEIKSAEAPRPPASLFSLEGFTKALNGSRPLAFLLAFLAGVLTSFTPCIFPMIPITLAILGRGSETRTRGQNFLLSLVYVHGIAVTYSILGLFAVKTGSLFGSSLGNAWVVGTLCTLMLTMALSLFGLYELQVPAALRNRFGRGTHHTGYFGSFVSGLLAGIIASPCVGPILVAILAFVSTQASYWLGFFFLFTYAMGMGMLFLILGAFSELTKKLPRSGPWMERVKIFLGLLMLGAFYYYLQFVLDDRWWNLALGIGLVLLSSFYGAFSKVDSIHPMKRIRKGLMLATFLIGVIYSAAAVMNWSPSAQESIVNSNLSAEQKLDWKPWSLEALAEAQKSGKPVIVDFWAEWCAACHELERLTFTDSDVRKMSEKFTLLTFDATQDSPLLRQLKKKYKIQGLPTVLFIDSKGEWLEALTLTEFEKHDRFLQRMKKVDPAF